MKSIKLRSINPVLIFFFITVAIIESVWIISSDGFYYIDECSHYLYSRFVLQALPATVQTWHRPIPQWLFALPAQLGHTFTMFFAGGLFLCLLLITYRIAMLKGLKHSEWVVVLVGLQPILFDLSYACMTEVPAAIMISLSYYYYLKEEHGLSLALASAVIMCRSEMYVFAGLMFFVYAWKRKWKILPLVLLGPLCWIGSTTLISGNVMTFFNEWSKFSHIGKFIPGVSVTHYIENLHTTFGVAQALLFIAGIVALIRSKKIREYGIILSAIAITIIIHTLAGAEVFHWTASIGELRYISVVGPFWGIISLYGLSQVMEMIHSSRTQIIFLVLLFDIIVFNCVLTTHPRQWANYDKVVINIIRTLKIEYPDITLLSNSCVAAYAMDVAPSGGINFAQLNKETLHRHPKCLILWDPFSANSIFFQTEITKEGILHDATVHIVRRYTYWNAEYLILYKHE